MARFCMAVLLASLVSSLPAETLPLFDGHIHYNADAQQSYSPEAVLKILREGDIARALVSSTPNEGTRKLYDAAPRAIVPLVRPYRSDADRATWFNNPEVFEFVRRELEHGIYRGIGEFHVQGQDANTPVMRRFVDLAAERGLPLHAHSDQIAVEILFSLKPKSKIIWAHAGMTAPPGTIAKLLERYPSLWVELSYRSEDIAPRGELDPQWRALFVRYADRFIVGTDTWAASRWEALPRLSRETRNWLSQLPGEVAAKIAHDNAVQLFP
jgi:hypothetical protein